MNNQINAGGVSGEYLLIVSDAKTKEVKREYRQSNFITDAGLNYIMTHSENQTAIHEILISTDNTPVTATSTTIGTIAARSTTIIDRTFVADPNYFSYQVRFEVDTTNITGTLTKIGITTETGVLFSATSLANLPTPPKLIKGEMLTVVYTYKYILPATSAVRRFTDIDIGDSTNSVTIKRLNIDQTNPDLASRLDRPFLPMKVVDNLPKGNSSAANYSIAGANISKSDTGFISNTPFNIESELSTGSTRGFIVSWNKSVPASSTDIKSILLSTNYGIWCIEFDRPVPRLSSSDLLVFQFSFSLSRVGGV